MYAYPTPGSYPNDPAAANAANAATTASTAQYQQAAQQQILGAPGTGMPLVSQAMYGYPPAGYQQMPGAGYPLAQSSSTASLTGFQASVGSTPSGVEEEEERKDVVPMVCNQYFNVHELLAQSILSCDYYLSLHDYKTFQEVVDGIPSEVRHLRPKMAGKSGLPSAAFCFLYKFFMMRLSYKQLRYLLKRKDNVYIKAIGILYIRFVCDSSKLREWFGPYIDDPQELSVGGDGKSISFSHFIEQLMVDMNYFDITLKRIPIPIVRQFKRTLLERELRRKKNDKYRIFFARGVKVLAQYADMQFYDAVVDDLLPGGNLLVTYTEYGEQEEVDVARIKIPKDALEKFRAKHNGAAKNSSSREGGDKSRGGSRDRDRDRDRDKKRDDRDRKDDRKRGRRSRSRSRDRKRRSRSRSKDRSRRDRDRRKRSRSPARGGKGGKGGKPVFSDDEEVDLDKEVLRRERMGAVVSSGKDYARRPVGYKQSLSHTNAPTKFAGHQEPRRGNYARRKKDVQREASPSPETNRSAAASNPQARARLLKLRAAYGDASSGKAAANKDKGGDFEM